MKLCEASAWRSDKLLADEKENLFDDQMPTAAVPELLDWLPLNLPVDLEVVNDGQFPFAPSHATLAYNNNYRLEITIFGKVGDSESLGTTLPDEPLKAKLRHNSKNHPQLDVHLSKISVYSMEQSVDDCTLKGLAGNAIVTTMGASPNQSLDKCQFVVEWLFDGPSQVNWSRGTKYRFESGGFRERGNEKIDVSPANQPYTICSTDHMQLEIDVGAMHSLKFGIIDQDRVPASKIFNIPCFIEYALGPDGLPSAHSILSVRRALSFLFGSGLGLLGRTLYGDSGRFIQAEIHSGYSPGGKNFHLPAHLHDHGRHIVDERHCSNFILAYLQNEKKFQLNRVIWLLRHSLSATRDMAPGYIGVALEILRNHYFKRPGNAKRKRCIAKEAWNPLKQNITQTLNDFSKIKPEHSDSIARIERKLDNLNELPAAMQNQMFLSELNIESSDEIRDSLLYRNHALHGSGPSDDDPNMEKWRHAYLVVLTLTSRAIFNLLGIRPYGYYDYSRYCATKMDYEIKAWDDPQGKS